MTLLVSQAFDLVLYGMGTVFVFLTVLVFMTMLMSALLSRGKIDTSASATQDVSAVNQGVDPKIIAAISAAVKRHRHSKQ
ncbi:MAG: oxaloacetate decarboxylase gamma subunit [Candidatus Azotimanducaceae bacterium]|jgi:oxaloacetate decarboxylase gamma subunit